MADCHLYVTILNFDRLIDDSEAIIEAGSILGLPGYMIELWVWSFLHENIKIKVG